MNNHIKNRLSGITGVHEVFYDLVDNIEPPVVDVGIDWHEGFGNTPTMHLSVVETMVDQLSYSNPIWIQDPLTHVCHADVHGLYKYIMAKDGMVTAKSSGLLGFGGRTFTICLHNGEVIKTNNAWSSRAGAVVTKEPLYEVVVHTAEKGGLDQMGFSGYAIGEKAYKAFIKAINLHFVQDCISADPEMLVKPDGKSFRSVGHEQKRSGGVFHPDLSDEQASILGNL